MNELQMGRRDVLRLIATIPGAALLVGACSSETLSDLSDEEAAVVGRISANHDHTATLTEEDLTSTSTLTLDITGTSDHPHTITLTTAQLADIAAGRRVNVVSSNDDGHNHRVTFN